MSFVSTHPVTFAFAIESNFAEAPGYVLASADGGTAPAWASADGTTAFRHEVISADPSFLKRSSIADPSLNRRMFQTKKSIVGLRSTDGGSLQITFCGAEAETSAASQVSATGLSRLLAHALGGQHRGNTTAVAAAPSSDVSFDIDAATNIEAGCTIAIADAGDTERLFPVQVLTVSGTSITTDCDLPFAAAIAEDDEVHACITSYPDADNLNDTSDANHSLSLLYVVGGKVWEGVGCKLQLSSIEFARNDVPKLNFDIFAAASFADGDADCPSEPTFTGTVQGGPGLAIGADTKLHIQTNGTTTLALKDCTSATLTVGVPAVPFDTMTQSNGAAQGRSGYLTKPEDTMFEVTVPFSNSYEAAFEAGTEYVLRYMQVASPGNGWAVTLPRCVLAEAPAKSEANEAVMTTLKFRALENDIASGDTENLYKAKFLISQF